MQTMQIRRRNPDHVLSKCAKAHGSKYQLLTKDIFNNDPAALKDTAKKIEEIINTLNNPPNNQQNPQTPKRK